MARNRFGLGCILVPIGLLVVLVAGTWLFMKFLASALHPDPQAIPSVTRREPSPQWSEAVNRARRSIRASLAEQNLPGLSVAVGVGGSMVWTEGFGWAHIETACPSRRIPGSGSERLPLCSLPPPSECFWRRAG